MRKVNLRMNELLKYDIIKNLVNNNGNKLRAATMLQCSLRTINRLIFLYKTSGKEGFVHGNRSKQPITTIDEMTKNTILSLYDGKYQGANFAHFNELLAQHEAISISYSALYQLFKINEILSPKCERATKKNLAKLIKQRARSDSDSIDTPPTTSPLIPLEEAHPRQARCKYFGEKILLDASNHLWFGTKKAFLHLAIDDATSHIVGAYFDLQETLKGYYSVLNQMLLNYGIACAFQSDNRTIFNCTKENLSSLERDTHTQFSYACKQLGIAITTTSIAQKQGRVERSFQTHQSRLILELRLAGINTIEEANLYLEKYIVNHNLKFALPIHNIKSVFESQPSISEINCILANITQRTIDNGNTIKYHNQYYLPHVDGNLVTLRPKTKCLVIKAFDGQLFLSAGDDLFNLVELESHQLNSPEFDMIPDKTTPKKQHIPPMQHPWRNSNFLKHVKSQKHHIEKEIADYHKSTISN